MKYASYTRAARRMRRDEAACHPTAVMSSAPPFSRSFRRKGYKRTVAWLNGIVRSVEDRPGAVFCLRRFSYR